MSQVQLIISGLILFFLINISVTTAFIFIYFKIIKEKNNLKEKFLLSLFLSAVNYFIQILTLIIFFAVGPIGLYSAVAVTSMLGYALILKHHYHFDILRIAIITFSLTILLSPAWMRLLGIK
ncbi:MAG: hypothetical protein WCP14_03960 [bacterium]